MQKLKRKALRDKLLLEQLIQKNNQIGATSINKLDYLDRQAVENWQRAFKKLERAKGHKRTSYSKKQQIEKIIDMYKAYGD